MAVSQGNMGATWAGAFFSQVAAAKLLGLVIALRRGAGVAHGTVKEKHTDETHITSKGHEVNIWEPVWWSSRCSHNISRSRAYIMDFTTCHMSVQVTRKADESNPAYVIQSDKSKNPVLKKGTELYRDGELEDAQ
jgi:hypothetical protein